MGKFIREYLQGYAMELRNMLEENVANGDNHSKEYRNDISLLTELNIWLGQEDETKMDG